MNEHNCINIAKIATLENEVKNMKEQMSDLKDIKNSLTVLTTLQQENEKRDVERDIDRKKQSDALVALSETPKLIAKLDKKLDLQNEKLQLHDEKFIDLDNKISNQSTDKTNKTEISKAKIAAIATIMVAICSGLSAVILSVVNSFMK